jgi:1-phosphofructokinase
MNDVSQSKAPAKPSGITIFAPTPLLTVTMEAKSDGRAELHIHAGGQGFWVARMIARLGERVTLCTPLGGDTGRLLKTLMADEGVCQAADVAARQGVRSRSSWRRA